MNRRHNQLTIRLSDIEKRKLEQLATEMQRTRGDALRQLLHGAHEAVIATELQAIDGASSSVIPLSEEADKQAQQGPQPQVEPSK